MKLTDPIAIGIFVLAFAQVLQGGLFEDVAGFRVERVSKDRRAEVYSGGGHSSDRGMPSS